MYSINVLPAPLLKETSAVPQQSVPPMSMYVVPATARLLYASTANAILPARGRFSYWSMRSPSANSAEALNSMDFLSATPDFTPANAFLRSSMYSAASEGLSNTATSG